MKLNFIYVIIDYFSISRCGNTWFTEWLIPFFLVLVGYVLVENQSLSFWSYSLVVNLVATIRVLLGFTLASMTLFLGRTSDELKKKRTERIKLRGKTLSLYNVMLITFSYLIILETLLCVSYYIGLLYPLENGNICAFLNGLFLLLSFHLFATILKMITNLYFILIADS